jgi:hypothetical protein
VKMPPKGELVEIGGRCFLGSASILFDRGLIRSALEYGSVCFTNIARTHMLALERVQYRSLRICECLWLHTTTCGKIRILEL